MSEQTLGESKDLVAVTGSGRRKSAIERRKKWKLTYPNAAYTDEKALEMVKHVSAGLPLQFAAAKAGVLWSTASNWLQDGKQDADSPYAPFALAIEAAQAEVMEEVLFNWRDLGLSTKQWTAFATFAERMWPEVFSKKEKGGPQVQVNIGIVEGRVQELQAKGELSYGGG